MLTGEEGIVFRPPLPDHIYNYHGSVFYYRTGELFEESVQGLVSLTKPLLASVIQSTSDRKMSA